MDEPMKFADQDRYGHHSLANVLHRQATFIPPKRWDSLRAHIETLAAERREEREAEESSP